MSVDSTIGSERSLNNKRYAILFHRESGEILCVVDHSGLYSVMIFNKILGEDYIDPNLFREIEKHTKSIVRSK